MQQTKKKTSDGGSVSSEEQRKAQLKEEKLYRRLAQLAKVMDRWGVDPAIGFLLPAFGDVLTALLALPFLYYSVVRLRSFPLTVALVYNVLLDLLIGLVPYGIGDFFDIFHRSYLKNLRLLTGYVEGNEAMMDEVQRKTGWTMVLLFVLAGLIILFMGLTYWLLSSGLAFLSQH